MLGAVSNSWRALPVSCRRGRGEGRGAAPLRLRASRTPLLKGTKLSPHQRLIQLKHEEAPAAAWRAGGPMGDQEQPQAARRYKRERDTLDTLPRDAVIVTVTTAIVFGCWGIATTPRQLVLVGSTAGLTYMAVTVCLEMIKPHLPRVPMVYVLKGALAMLGVACVQLCGLLDVSQQLTYPVDEAE